MTTKKETIQERLDAKADRKLDADMNEFSKTFRELFNGISLSLSVQESPGKRTILDNFDLVIHLAKRYKDVNRGEYRARAVTEFEKQFKQMAEQFEETIGFED